MIHKTNAAYLELHTYASRQKNTESFVSNDPGDFCRAPPLVLKMATPQRRSWCVLQLVKKESATAVQRAFRTHFHMEPPSRISFYAWYKKFEQKGCIYIHHKGHSAQSLVRVGLSSRHLPCDLRSTYRVSVRWVQNFESFSIDWCRCEVLCTPRVLSVSFWKFKVLLCSPCI
jgi:hypothetical protein